MISCIGIRQSSAGLGVKMSMLLVPTVAGFRSNPSVGELDLEMLDSSAAIDVRSVD